MKISNENGSFRAVSVVLASANDVFAWHEHPDAFERLTPPWAEVESLEHQGGIEDGASRTLQVRFGPLRRKWRLEHRNYQPGEQFQDVQVEGPFKSWIHTHRFESMADNRCRMVDLIQYELPGGMVGRLLGKAIMGQQLERLFRYRHTVICDTFGCGPDADS